MHHKSEKGIRVDERCSVSFIVDARVNIVFYDVCLLQRSKVTKKPSQTFGIVDGRLICFISFS